MFIEATTFQALYFFHIQHPVWYFYSPKYDFVFHRVWPSKTQHNISFTGLTPEKQFLILKNWNITAVQLSRQNIFALLPEIFKNSEFWNYFKKISSFVWSILNISNNQCFCDIKTFLPIEANPNFLPWKEDVIIFDSNFTNSLFFTQVSKSPNVKLMAFKFPIEG